MACRCGRLKNTGVPGSDVHFGIPQRWIYVPIYKDDGVTRNSIDPTDTFDEAYFTDLINSTDQGERWRPLPLMKNLEDTRAELIVQTFNDQSKFKIRKGTRSVNAVIPELGPHYLNVLESLGCVTFGVYEVDECGNIRGEAEEDGLIYPIRIEKGSWSPDLIKTTDSTVEQIMISFDYAQSIRDEMLEMIPSEEIEINLLTVNGLFDILALSSGVPAQTSLVVDIYQELYGFIGGRNPVTGLLITDFFSNDLTTASRIWNVTDAAAVTLLTVVESTSVPGRYTMTYASQTVSDVLRLYPKKNGYDFSQIYDGTHDLPAIV